MHALLALLGVFFSTVLFYIASGIQYVGVTFLIVYVGAVAVLFLFVLMLLNVKSLISSRYVIQDKTQAFSIVVAVLLYVLLQTRVMRSAGDTLSAD